MPVCLREPEVDVSDKADDGELDRSVETQPVGIVESLSKRPHRI
jgi:hypothetical protein